MEQISRDSIPQALQAAHRHLAAGRPRDAEILCGQILAVNPQEIPALRLLAMLAFHGQRPNIALDLLNRAMAFEPKNADLHVDLGTALLTMGQVEKAIASFRIATSLRSDHVAAHNNLAVALRQAGQLNEAIVALAKAIAMQPGLADRHVAMGDLLRETARPADAVDAYRAALRLRPDDPDVLLNLGAALNECEKFNEAIESLSAAVRLRPDSPVGHGNLAQALRSCDRFDEADAADAKADKLRENLAQAHRQAFEAAALHKENGHLREAEAIYRQIIQSAPAHAEAMLELGLLAAKAGRLHESVDWFRRAIATNPSMAIYHANLGEAYRLMQKFDLAEESLRKAIELQPSLVGAQFSLGAILMDTGDVEEAVAYFDQVLAAQPNHQVAANLRLFALHFHPDCDSGRLLKEVAHWAKQHAKPLKQHAKPHDDDRSLRRPLRVGYVSADFRDHVIGLNVLPILEYHDRAAFHVTCYSNNEQRDVITDLFGKYADQWRSITSLSDDQAAQCIAQDKIDILVDLALHTQGSRLLMFARKPAPIQVTFAGYPGTTGLSTIDYRLTDPYLDPPGKNDGSYSEQSIRLPHTFWCYADMASAIEVNALPALQAGRITFGCLNSPFKISKTTWQLWAEVCRVAADARLLLRAPTGTCRQRFCEKLGVAPDRVDFVDYQPRPQYMQTYHRIDIGLDTFPYNGHTTSLDSLWMGVPVISLCGQTVASRAGFSQASNLGLTELVARTPDEFVRIATELAQDLPRLAELRRALRSRMKASPLMDAVGFTKGIEAAYRQMWQSWQQSQR